MIKPPELRIGNYVYGVSERIEQVYEISEFKGIGTKALKQKLFFDDNQPEDLSGIPLTEEILLKMGFMKVQHILGVLSPWVFRKEVDFQWYQFNLTEKYPETNPNCGILRIFDPFEKDVPCPTDENVLNPMDWPESYKPFAWNIKHVHRLQNAWHSLTGEELTYTP